MDKYQERPKTHLCSPFSHSLQFSPIKKPVVMYCLYYIYKNHPTENARISFYCYFCTANNSFINRCFSMFYYLGNFLNKL